MFTGDWPSSGSIDNNYSLDDFWKDAHACNPTGPDILHTNSRYHVHTNLVAEEEEEEEGEEGEEDKINNNNNNTSSNDTAESTDKKSSKKRPIGNREAVRKYREKKKARAASLEEEVVKLRAAYQQLLKRLQSQAVLEAEIARLKCLLVDVRGRIEGEIGSFPYQKVVNPNVPANLRLPGGCVVNPCNAQYGNDIRCLHAEEDGKGGDGARLNGSVYSNFDFEDLHCLGNQDSGVKELPGCGARNGHQRASNVHCSGAGKRRGGPRAATAG